MVLLRFSSPLYSYAGLPSYEVFSPPIPSSCIWTLLLPEFPTKTQPRSTLSPEGQIRLLVPFPIRPVSGL